MYTNSRKALESIPNDKSITQNANKDIIDKNSNFYLDIQHFENDLIRSFNSFLERSNQLMPYIIWRDILESKKYNDPVVSRLLGMVGYDSFNKLKISGSKLVSEIEGLRVQLALYKNSYPNNSESESEEN